AAAELGERRAVAERWSRGRALKGLREGLSGVADFDFDAHVRTSVQIAGALEQHEFDIELLNGQPIRLIQGLALEGLSKRDREATTVTGSAAPSCVRAALNTTKGATTGFSFLSPRSRSSTSRCTGT